MKFLPVLTFCLMLCTAMCAQNDDMNDSKKTSEIPYHEIPESPEKYSPGNIAARTIDGLGYRYYWATKDLRKEDLEYRPSDDSRTAGETLDHLYGLSRTIANAMKKQPNIRPAEKKEMTWEEKRKATLENFKTASDILKACKDEEVEDFKIIFQRGEQTSEFPFWTLLNGPIADAIYHTGQIVAYRRASGNPLHPGVSVFRGKTREE